MDARAPNNYELAEKDYMDGMKYKDIASKYNVKLNTVKSWKKRYDWNRKGVHTKKEKVCTQKKTKEEPIAKEVESVLKNTELTDKQRLFCILYVKYRNKVKAYQKAYECSYECACGNASNLLKNIEIQKYYNQLLDEYRSGIDIELKDLFRWYLDIARADITDYLEWGREEIPVMGAFGPVKDDEGKPLTKVVNTIRFKESTEVDGILISEVKQGKDGTSIKLADRMKAMDWLSQHVDIASDKQKAELKLLQAQIDKLTLDNSPDDSEKISKVNNIASILEQMKPIEDGDVDE